MAVMGFTVHPGPLPFCTIRDADKWEGRLANGQIEIVGEHGCTMPQQMVRVVDIDPYDERFHGPLPGHLAALYKGRRLIAVWMDALTSPQEEVALPAPTTISGGSP